MTQGKLKGPFHEPTNHADEKQQPENNFGWRHRFNWSAVQCCLSFDWTVVFEVIVARTAPSSIRQCLLDAYRMPRPMYINRQQILFYFISSPHGTGSIVVK